MKYFDLFAPLTTQEQVNYDQNLRPDKLASSFSLTSSAISLCANVYIITILV
jgi:hypothetical protein